MAGFLPFAEWDEEREEINDQLETMYTNDICAYQVINQLSLFSSPLSSGHSSKWRQTQDIVEMLHQVLLE